MITKKTLLIPIDIPNMFSLLRKKKFEELVVKAARNTTVAYEKVQVFPDIENSWEKASGKDLQNISVFIKKLTRGEIKTKPIVTTDSPAL